MGALAKSFSVVDPSEEKVFRALEIACREVGSPAGILLFFGATAPGLMQLVGAGLPTRAPSIPALLVGAQGVLTEAGEVEGQAAVAGLVWSGPRASVYSIAGGSAAQMARSVLAALPKERRYSDTGLFFADSQRFDPDVLELLNQERVPPRLFGAGAVRAPATVCVDEAGNVMPGAAGLFVLGGLTPPKVLVSPACRLLMPLGRITETRGPLVLEIEDESALELLNRLGKELKGQPLILTALAPEGPGAEDGPSELLIRGIQGIDPVRGGVLVSPDVRPDLFMAFAVRDADAARVDLEQKTLELVRSTAGAAPRFGLYFNCAGRGRALYSAEDVDTRILKNKLGPLPLLGMLSPFEIGPYRSETALHMYTGILTVFTNPS
ncbi:MAG: FIST C-terminal domain-containing protein [Polyangiaceae bacterium]|nr:FIST C-terminal domain-containing protein [Polyangiaceae bacterium]